MSTPTLTRRGDRWVVWHGLDWVGYQTLLRARGGRSAPRITYLDGSALLVSPSALHEHLAKRMRIVVEDVASILEIPFVGLRSTTFGREERRGGVEADESYYVASVPLVEGRPPDPTIDPPPDLVIEAVHTHPVKKSLRTYRRLGVPEVWVYRAGRLRILVLQGDRYAEGPTSLAFPFLATDEIRDWIERPVTQDLAWKRELQAWIRAVLMPRHGGNRP